MAIETLDGPDADFPAADAEPPQLPRLFATAALTIAADAPGDAAGKRVPMRLDGPRDLPLPQGNTDYATAYNEAYSEGKRGVIHLNQPFHVLEADRSPDSDMFSAAYRGRAAAPQELGLHGFTIAGERYFLLQCENGSWAKRLSFDKLGQLHFNVLGFSPGIENAAAFRPVEVPVEGPGGRTVTALGAYQIARNEKLETQFVGVVAAAPFEANSSRAACILIFWNQKKGMEEETVEHLVRLDVHAAGADLPAFAHVRFPSVDSGAPPDWSDPRDEIKRAREDFIREIGALGVGPSANDPIDIAKLQRHHVRAAAMTLGAGEAHMRIREALMMLLDIRDDLDEYFRRISIYFLARFSLQQSIISEAAELLKISEQETILSDGLDLGDVFEAAVSIATSYEAHLAVLYNVCSLAIEIAEGERTRVDSDADFRTTVAQFMRTAADDYVAAAYGLEVLRDRNVVSVAALRQWQKTVPPERPDTEALDKAVNGVFRRYVWSRLLSVGCRLQEEKSDRSVAYHFNTTNPMYVIEEINRLLDVLRQNDRTIVGIRLGKFQPFTPGNPSGRYDVLTYTLKGREGGLPKAVEDVVFDEMRFPYRFLWESAGIPVVDSKGAGIPKPKSVTFERFTLPIFS